MALLDDDVECRTPVSCRFYPVDLERWTEVLSHLISKFYVERVGTLVSHVDRDPSVCESLHHA